MRHFDENSDSEAASILSPWIVRKIACLSDDTDEEFSARIKKSKPKPTVPHVSSRGRLSDNILSSYLNKAINLLSSESDAEYVSLRRKKFLPKSQSNFDKSPKVPMVSAKTKVSEHILNVKMDKEIDSLSSESDSEEEYTIEKVSQNFDLNYELAFRELGEQSKCWNRDISWSIRWQTKISCEKFNSVTWLPILLIWCQTAWSL